MEKNFADCARDELRHFTQTADNVSRKIERYLTDLALEIEYNNQHPEQLDLSIDRMDDVYDNQTDPSGNVLYIRSDKMNLGEMVYMCMGVERTPFNDDKKRLLKRYEYAGATGVRMYDELEYVDELWLFDHLQNTGFGRLEYKWSHFLVPGLDITLFYPLGLAYYDWFEMVDLPNNPLRQLKCSATPFVELFNQWIMHLKVPVYIDRYGPNEKLTGITSAHLNLAWLMRDTIDTSNLRIMIINDDSILVGMNPAAKKDIDLETYDPAKFSYDTVFEPEVGAYKRQLVSEILNLEHEKPDDVTALARKAKAEYNFTHTLQGKTYRCIKERAPELGFHYLALLDAD